MQTLKAILARNDERIHLKNGAICFLLVIATVILGLAWVY